MKENRNSKGQFKKGNPGRPKGSKNKVINEIRETFINFLNNNLETLQDDFNDLEPRERFDVIFKISKFVLPTLKAVEFGNVLDKLTEEDFNRLIQTLQEEQFN